MIAPLLALQDEADQLVKAGDRDGLVRLLCQIRDARTDLSILAKNIELELLPLAEDRYWVVEDLGEVRVRKNKKRNEWDSDALTKVLTARALDERIVNEESGEIESPWEAVARVLSECARPEWRLTPLRARGIQIDEYCVERDNGWSIELPPRKDA